MRNKRAQAWGGAEVPQTTPRLDTAQHRPGAAAAPVTPAVGDGTMLFQFSSGEECGLPQVEPAQLATMYDWQHPAPGVQIGRVAGKGVGLFADKDFQKGEVVYAVEGLLTQCPWRAQAQTALGLINISCGEHSNSLDCHTMKGFQDKHCVTADKARPCRWGEFTFFDVLINHSNKPNADYDFPVYNASLLTHHGRLRSEDHQRPRLLHKFNYVLALRDIFAGEEITADYEDFEEEGALWR